MLERPLQLDFEACETCTLSGTVAGGSGPLRLLLGPHGCYRENVRMNRVSACVQTRENKRPLPLSGSGYIISGLVRIRYFFKIINQLSILL